MQRLAPDLSEKSSWQNQAYQNGCRSSETSNAGGRIAGHHHTRFVVAKITPTGPRIFMLQYRTNADERHKPTWGNLRQTDGRTGAHHDVSVVSRCAPGRRREAAGGYSQQKRGIPNQAIPYKPAIQVVCKCRFPLPSHERKRHCKDFGLRHQIWPARWSTPGVRLQPEPVAR